MSPSDRSSCMGKPCPSGNLYMLSRSQSSKSPEHIGHSECPSGRDISSQPGKWCTRAARPRNRFHSGSLRESCSWYWHNTFLPGMTCMLSNWLQQMYLNEKQLIIFYLKSIVLANVRFALLFLTEILKCISRLGVRIWNTMHRGCM